MIVQYFRLLPNPEKLGSPLFLGDDDDNVENLENNEPDSDSFERMFGGFNQTYSPRSYEGSDSFEYPSDVEIIQTPERRKSKMDALSPFSPPSILSAPSDLLRRTPTFTADILLQTQSLFEKRKLVS